MPVFWLLVILIAAALWVLLSFVFIPLGKLVAQIWKNAKDAMQKEDTANSKNEEE